MKTILEALQFREWHVNKRGVAYCPVCGGKRHLGGHKQDCEYLARMKEAERLPKRLEQQHVTDYDKIKKEFLADGWEPTDEAFGFADEIFGRDRRTSCDWHEALGFYDGYLCGMYGIARKRLTAEELEAIYNDGVKAEMRQSIEHQRMAGFRAIQKAIYGGEEPDHE